MCSSAVEKQRKLDFNRNIELCFEVFELCFLVAVRETVVIESEFAECDGMRGSFRREGKGAEGREERAGGCCGLGELGALTGVDADGCVNCTGWEGC